MDEEVKGLFTVAETAAGALAEEEKDRLKAIKERATIPMYEDMIIHIFVCGGIL